jgi:molybdate transport system ATP-binding protein
MDSLRVDIAVGLRSFDVRADLEVTAETVALVGPSGAGKTTILRAIAGLVRPATGRVTLGGDVWFDASRNIDLAPEQRSVGMVFQHYALFPHLSVRGNVRYAGPPEVADELLERFGLREIAAAKPAQISGGERQRVALARALARQPDVLLLDEPMSALDPHTRASVRAELREILRALGLPTLLVTHDFNDAAALADRVGVIVDGAIVQLATAADLLARPASAFVAGFTGAIPIPGVASPSADGLTRVLLAGGAEIFSTDPVSGDVDAIVQPWDITISRRPTDDSALNQIRAPISSMVPIGNRVRITVGPITAEITAASAERLSLADGDTVTATFKASGTRLIPTHADRRPGAERADGSRPRRT